MQGSQAQEDQAQEEQSGSSSRDSRRRASSANSPSRYEEKSNIGEHQLQERRLLASLPTVSSSLLPSHQLLVLENARQQQQQLQQQQQQEGLLRSLLEQRQQQHQHQPRQQLEFQQQPSLLQRSPVLLLPQQQQQQRQHEQQQLQFSQQPSLAGLQRLQELRQTSNLLNNPSHLALLLQQQQHVQQRVQHQQQQQQLQQLLLASRVAPTLMSACGAQALGAAVAPSPQVLSPQLQQQQQAILLSSAYSLLSPVAPAGTQAAAPPATSSNASQSSASALATPDTGTASLKKVLCTIGSTNRSKVAGYLDVTSLDGFEDLRPHFAQVRGVTVAEPFPDKLYRLLTSDKNIGASFLPHGRSFRVHNMNAFVQEALPKFFKQTKWSSFARQLNLWGFTRIFHGSSRDGGRDRRAETSYYHELFLHGLPDLCGYMRRVGVATGGSSGSGTVDRAVTTTEPDYYSMKSLVPYQEEERRRKVTEPVAAVAACSEPPKSSNADEEAKKEGRRHTPGDDAKQDKRSGSETEVVHLPIRAARRLSKLKEKEEESDEDFDEEDETEDEDDDAKATSV